jgi:hypothetical protein
MLPATDRRGEEDEGGAKTKTRTDTNTNTKQLLLVGVASVVLRGSKVTLLERPLTQDAA